MADARAAKTKTASSRVTVRIVSPSIPRADGLMEAAFFSITNHASGLWTVSSPTDRAAVHGHGGTGTTGDGARSGGLVRVPCSAAPVGRVASMRYLYLAPPHDARQAKVLHSDGTVGLGSSGAARAPANTHENVAECTVGLLIEHRRRLDCQRMDSY